MDLALCISLTPEHSSHLADEDLAELDSPALKDALVKALSRLGSVRVWDTTVLSPAEIAREKKPDLVFNVAEGIYGTAREAQAPALFEWLGWRYVGSDPVTLAVTHDKWLTHCVLERAGVPTARAARVDGLTGREKKLDLRYPLIVKPVAEGAGKGIHDSSVVDDERALDALIEPLLRRHGQALLLEEFLPGREFTVAVLGNRGAWEALPIVEIDFSAIPESPRRVYGYHAKFTWHGEGHMRCPAPIGEPLRREIEALAVASCEALGIRDWARVDIRLDAAGKPHVLELNPLPGIYPDEAYISCFTKAAYAAGMTFDGLIERLVRLSMARYESPWFLPHKQR
ncbi:MAG: ATP-grasp domain-containing protein [Byssovorax sp.]